jgi:N-acyl homoserine lactone hydrolase
MTHLALEGPTAHRPRVSECAALVLAGLVLAGCGSFRPAATAFHAPAPSAHDWDAVFSRPARASVERLETGRVRVMRSDLIDFDDPKAGELHDERLFVPVYAYLVRHDDRGDYLVDAGLDRSFQRTARGATP